MSGGRLVWVEGVGTNGAHILTARLGERPRVLTSIPNRRVRLGVEGDDSANVSLAAWPGGVAYAYNHQHCFAGCFGGADTNANPSSATMRIVVVPFGGSPRCCQHAD